jgi:predicted NBD/HSP70 family sugar kinase
MSRRAVGIELIQGAGALAEGPQATGTPGTSTVQMIRAVVVDETGRVHWRGEKTGGAPRAGAALLKEAAKTADRVAAAGIAVYDGGPDGVDRAMADALGLEPRAVGAGLAAVTAETWIGAARGMKHVVALVLGERIAAGLLIDGHPWEGAHGLAGSAAWLALNPVERQDYRKFGSLDAEVSARGIARRLVWRIQAGDRSGVLEKAGDLDAITAGHVFDGARGRDGVSISVVRDTAKYIAMAVANLVATVDPDIVVLDGDLAAAGDLLLEPVRQECARRLSPALFSHLRVEISPLGSDAIAIGAARLALNAP